jgi:outer membrane protein insertion porin family
VQARPRIDRNTVDLLINLTINVDEGQPSYVERLEIYGNTRTRDYVIRREFDIAEGDPFNRVLIERAQRRLRNLGYFDEVRISTTQGSSPDRVVVAVNVTEKATGSVSFGAGYSTSDGIIGDVALTETNFLGRGYNLRVAVGGGESTKNYELSFTDPYFLGRRISAGFTVFRREYEDNDFRSYDYEETGGGLNLGFPITENFTVQVGYQLKNEEIDVPGYDKGVDLSGAAVDDPATPENELPGLQCIPGVSLAICQAEGDSIVSSALYSLVYDSLDDRTDPHDGIYAKFTQEFAGVGGDVSFLRTTGTAAIYRELNADAGLVGFLRVQGGHIVGIGEDVRLLDAFFKGGETVRGFESSGFGPRDLTTGDALGGTIFAAATAEVQFPIPRIPRELGFRGALFADAGTLFDSDVSESDFPGIIIGDEASIRSSIGGSILWASPLGPLRADFAYVLTSESYDEEQFFRIGGGTRF